MITDWGRTIDVERELQSTVRTSYTHAVAGKSRVRFLTPSGRYFMEGLCPILATWIQQRPGCLGLGGAVGENRPWKAVE